MLQQVELAEKSLDDYVLVVGEQMASRIRRRAVPLDGVRLPEAQQRRQIHASWLFGQWLREEADQHNIPVVAPHPRKTLIERISGHSAGRRRM